MHVLQTPPELRQAPTPYPAHSVGHTIETAAHAFLMANQAEIETDLIYLPVFWQSNYFADRKATRSKDYGAVAAVQAFLDSSLDPGKRYFTISQADEGTYERLPPNVIVFSGGGAGHIPLPLLCDDHRPVKVDRSILASFIGTIETGGPLKLPGMDRPRRSSWDINGPGAVVRRAMRDAFSRRKDCRIETTLSGPAARDRFINLACSSKFALAPRGYGRTSFRLYEAMKLGAVPVYIFDDCWLPYHDVLDWNQLGILCHVSKVAELPGRLDQVTDKQLQDFRQYAANTVPGYFTLDGMCRQIARYISTIS
jgi:hypothetical protein